ncbi:protein bark beetle-like [Orbicella faveolata]|uniref:protein bark beetle-like n=1 Tax=Orbicella faveolata TaxID=48498 RepID=UPI0009E457F9|nr:protein bark beetle-like [Orbicella faveolata]
MINYSPVIHIIIYLLLLVIVTLQRVENASIGGDITVDTTLTLNGSAYVVSKDLVVAENATLTIEPGVQLLFKAGVALQVKGSLQAKGNSNGRIAFSKIPTNSSENVDDLNVTAPYNNGSRLVGGKNYRVGRLEIFLRGQWGTVCDDSFDINDARVACRQLGFLGAKRFYRHGRGTGPTWLDDVNCMGTEESLLECKYPGIGVENCGHFEDVGVECHSLAKLLSSKVYWKGIDFSSTQKTSSLQYVDMSLGYEAIIGGEYLPDLEHVTIKGSLHSVRSDNLSSPLTINDTSIKDNQFAGIRIKGRSKAVTIQNTAVWNTTNGDGLSYSQIVPDPVDFCSVDVNAITFPINLQALGKARTNVECTKGKLLQRVALL